METTTFLMILFAICCVWYWVPDILNTCYYCKYRMEDFVDNFKHFVKYLRFKFKNRKRE